MEFRRATNRRGNSPSDRALPFNTRTVLVWSAQTTMAQLLEFSRFADGQPFRE
jgi:hypothetical protein